MAHASHAALRNQERIFSVGVGASEAAVVLRDGKLEVTLRGARVVLQFEEHNSRLALRSAAAGNPSAVEALSAAAEAVLGWFPQQKQLMLDLDADESLTRAVLALGIAVRSGGVLEIKSELTMQRPGHWLPGGGQPPFPRLHVMTDGKRHPLRPPKPNGVVYRRFIPWLDQTISLRALEVEGDLPIFHRWMNDPRVDQFWNEAGGVDKHRTYLSRLRDDPHMLPLIGYFDDRPFGYFEVYWAKENRIAPFYDADDYDRGWHVVVGEDAFRGRDFISAWLPSLMHYIFLDDCRTQRIVGEPAAAHLQQIRNLEVSGFSKIKNFDFPHKRATLVMLLRERFFGDRLWLPAQDASMFAT